MLSSEIAFVSQTSLSLSSSLAPSAAMLQPTRRFPSRIRTSQQTRSFRFGLWSYLDPASQKELQHHHRISKHKYNELLNQNVSWNRKLRKSSRHLGLKGFMCSAWQRQDVRPGGRWTRTSPLDDVDGGPRKTSQNRAEDPRSDSFEHILHHSAAARNLRKATSRIFSSPIFPFDVQESGADAKRASASEASSNGRNEGLDYMIDPITNKKVLKESMASPENSTRKSIPLPMKTFKEYQSQFQRFAPPNKPEATKDGFEAYDAEMSYDKPFLAYEPDGKPQETPDPVQEGLKAYDSEMSYDEPFTAYEPDGKPQETPDPVQEGLKAYDSQISYNKPFTAYEPDGQPPAKEMPDQVHKGLKSYDSKISYDKPFMAYEPDGRPPTQESTDPVQQGLKTYDEVASYNKPFVAYEPDGKPPTQDPLGLTQKALGAFDSKAPYKKPFLAYEPDGQAPPQHEKLGPVQQAVKFYYDGANKKSRVNHNQPNGQPFVHWSSDVPAASKHLRNHKQKSKAEKRAMRQKLDREFDNLQETQEYIPEEAAAMEKVKQARALAAEDEAPLHTAPREMTGNFARDFPQDFEATWIATRDESGMVVPKIESTAEDYNISTKDMEQAELQDADRRVQKAEKEFMDHIIPCGGLSESSDSSKIQPSLDRVAARENDTKAVQTATHLSAQQDLQSKGTENPHDIALGEATVQTPTLYKILAYDPTMQSISIAETTSIVTDSATALTPAEVLLRLSNPTKYMPHFESLQSEGYEIASGSGDVLIFRKVREGSPQEPSSPPPASGRELKKSPRNPIDGMYPVVATGNFASPTGFVNLDFPEPTEDEPAFKSNIDVRREEPVFSGKRNWQDEQVPKTKKSGRGKRLLIGGVWVAACSYAVGVVAEFFKTGGMDGTGPQGF
ncbi:uncharacterized protein BP5553_08149 [Venustampulla echinocandica]|uniref:Serine-threonine rich protein n=1 Tax=Venustampulla echinocandica TaxID=2656787 RepID=A0A370TFX3_9HELO|nr:uncharacterized protein BP5553_08149 [Venustampulla echinocandica]RDL33781.1 hypothetical protein BP5553_08149 [Venustampulla echinocandica]